MKAIKKRNKRFDHRRCLVNASKSTLPNSAHIIRIIWSFKRKRNIFVDQIKHKARLCVHGGMQQEGISFRNTFLDVINWSIVRLNIIMATMAGW